MHLSGPGKIARRTLRGGKGFFLNRLSALFYHHVNLRLLVLSILIFALFLGLILPSMAGRLAEVTGTAVSPDTTLLYSPGQLYSMAEEYGSAGRAYYIYTRYTFDLAWPLGYLYFLTASLSFLYRWLPPASRLRSVNLLPLGGAVFDFLENSAASLVFYRYPSATPLAAALAPAFTFSKWVLLGLSFAALAAGIVLFTLHRLQTKRR